MSMVLQDARGRALRVSGFNWGALHGLVAFAQIFPEQLWLPKRFNESGALLPFAARRLRVFLQQVVLPALRPGERLQLDGTVTSGPVRPMHEDEADAWRDYGIERDALVGIIEFLRDAEGAVEFR